MAISAVLIDDEPLAIETLKNLCALDERIAVIDVATAGDDGAVLVERLQPDLVFLDIGMPGMNGLQVAHALKLLSTSPLIVFVTAYDHYATEAFDLNIADYVLKPVQALRFRRAIDRVADELRRRVETRPSLPDDLWLPRRGTMARVPVAAITKVQAERDYARIFTRDENFLLRATMSSIAERLASCGLLRIHRSTILAKDLITGFFHDGNGAWTAIDDSGAKHPIGRRYLRAVREELDFPALVDGRDR